MRPIAVWPHSGGNPGVGIGGSGTRSGVKSGNARPARDAANRVVGFVKDEDSTALVAKRAAAGSVKKTVAARLQKIPIAQVIPSPLNDGFRAQANEPKPLIAVKPASTTGLMTPATS